MIRNNPTHKCKKGKRLYDEDCYNCKEFDVCVR